MKEVALVMEAAGGVGLEASLQLARDGFRVFASVLSFDQSTTLSCRARALGVEVTPLTMEPDSAQSVARTVSEVLWYGGRLDVLVNASANALCAAVEAALPTLQQAGRGRVLTLAGVQGAQETRHRLAHVGVSVTVIDTQDPALFARTVARAARPRRGWWCAVARALRLT